MSVEAEVVVEVERVRCGHNARLGAAHVVGGEPYVLAHFDAGSLESLAAELAKNGHPFRVSIVDRYVSAVEWYA